MLLKLTLGEEETWGGNVVNKCGNVDSWGLRKSGHVILRLSKL